MRREQDGNRAERIRGTVRQGYKEIASGGGGCCGCDDPQRFARLTGYSYEDIDSLPEGANMGLSCGNPTAVAGLKAGQVVLDLGSGGGFDVFIAARKVGPAGRVIGVDMTAEMLGKARAAAAKFRDKTGLSNVEFRLGEIEHLPVADSSVDVVISNCVINLSPDKPQVWREVWRVLKPGGKACVSDIGLKAELPEQVRAAAEALVGCVAGAVGVAETIEMMQAAGLSDIEVSEKPYNIDVMESCCGPVYGKIRGCLPKGRRLGDYVVSADFVGYRKG